MNQDRRLKILKDIGIEPWARRPPKVKTSINAPLSWEALQTSAQNCQACDLGKTRANIVFGVGIRQASLMIIGEMPNKEEEQKGEPFVGAAGKLLNAMLAAIGLGRDRVFVTNSLKCQPPNNRDPSLSEINQCADFLHQQIAQINPSVILCVGRIAAQTLLGSNLAIERLRGQAHRYKTLDIPLIVSYHPAYLLRKPSEKAKAWQDLKSVFGLLKS